MRILIAEDNPDSAESLKVLLQGLGYDANPAVLQQILDSTPPLE